MCQLWTLQNTDNLKVYLHFFPADFLPSASCHAEQKSVEKNKFLIIDKLQLIILLSRFVTAECHKIREVFRSRKLAIKFWRRALALPCIILSLGFYVVNCMIFSRTGQFGKMKPVSATNLQSPSQVSQRRHFVLFIDFSNEFGRIPQFVLSRNL